MDSANAGLCAADAGMFPAYHKSLFGDQPEEGSRGWDDQQLAKLGTDLGITSADVHDLRDQWQVRQPRAGQLRPGPEGALPAAGVPGTARRASARPTIAVGEKVVDTAKSNWLDKLIETSARPARRAAPRPSDHRTNRFALPTSTLGTLPARSTRTTQVMPSRSRSAASRSAARSARPPTGLHRDPQLRPRGYPAGPRRPGSAG